MRIRMATRGRQLGRRLLCACGALMGWAGIVQANEPVDSQSTVPLIGCGKGRAMATRFLAEREPQAASVGVREAGTDTDVQHYDLDIELTNISPATNTCTITGTNVMTVQSKSAALTEFTFQLRNNYTITGATINSTVLNPGTDIATIGTTTRVVTLDQTYGLDDLFTLTIDYTGNSTSAGFGSIDVSWHFGVSLLPVVVATLSEPYFANTWWPVKDTEFAEPGDNSDKSTMDFSITVPDSMTVPSNGALLSVEVLSGNRKRYNWSSINPIAPYLVSFAASEYNTWTEFYNHAEGSMPVEFYIYPIFDAPANRNEWGKCVDMLPVFASLFGEYPFVDEKYGIYQFNFSGGMEHQTMTGQGVFIEHITAHELAHQWWGDHVTCKTWQDIWLNEGFATYSECLWEEYKGGASNPTAYFNAVQSRRPFNASRRVYVPLSGLSDLNRIFDSSSSYQKGCWVLHMLRGVVGTSTFFQILADYRAQYGGSAATTDDFKTVASATYGQDLTWFISQWIYQPGTPNYSFGWQTTNVAGQDYLLVHIEQTHTNVNYPSFFTMPVKLSATIGGSDETQTVWNDARSEWYVMPTSAPTTALSFDPSEWILRGSLSGVSYVSGPPVVVGAAPAPGEAIDFASSPTQVSVTFHTPVNVTAGDFSVVGDAGGVQAFDIASLSNVNPVVLDLDAPLPADDYTLTISAGMVSVASGLALDGEIDDPVDIGSLPSGDGQPGGDAVIRFTVTAPATPGDCTEDGTVNLVDFNTFANCFGLIAPSGGCDAAAFACSDLDVNGVVNLVDFATFASYFDG